MSVTIDGYEDFVKNGFKVAIDNYFGSLDVNPVEVYRYMKDLSLDYEDIGYKFKCGLILREESNNYVFGGGWYVADSERREGEFVIYEYYQDSELLYFLKKKKVEFLYQLKFDCFQVEGYRTDNNKRAFIGFASPYLSTLIKHYPSLNLSNKLDSKEEFREGMCEYSVIVKLK